ncbi:hypothetical protein ENSA5_10400 [Enhygromyxa salina]|uniref:Endo-1,4-beta-xylanase A n=1 Tax=Enhygromyxa salina TaxID=215803 RepID=A0A2S9YGB3_9BACT|nr:hypothetical protein [Enhygromyxa salina]PRQ04150.1 hypothetical protein ENSA5_10400 [Enhygromyxa salina]
MTNKTPYIFSLLACLGLALAPVGCAKDPGDDDGAFGDTDTTGDGDGDESGTGDQGDTETGDGDGDTGDGDGDTGDGDGDTGGDAPNGATCTSDGECLSGNCYIVPLLGGQCGECNEDADCSEGGCTAPNPFENNGSTCNMGEAGGGCETDDVCMEGLSCGNVLSLVGGLITMDTCGQCASDNDCTDQICAPVVSVEDFSGENTCIEANSLPQDSYCKLEGNGDEACGSGICSTIDIEGLAEVGACGECNTDDDCDEGTCQAGEFVIETGSLVGSTCVI